MFDKCNMESHEGKIRIIEEIEKAMPSIDALPL
jgi:hypothetical protein